MLEQRPVNPAEIQKDIKEFLEKKYGTQVIIPQAEVEGIQ
jgi:hypothetical protein